MDSRKLWNNEIIDIAHCLVPMNLLIHAVIDLTRPGYSLFANFVLVILMFIQLPSIIIVYGTPFYLGFKSISEYKKLDRGNTDKNFGFLEYIRLKIRTITLRDIAIILVLPGVILSFLGASNLPLGSSMNPIILISNIMLLFSFGTLIVHIIKFWGRRTRKNNL